jgi:hypothetical protein
MSDLRNALSKYGQHQNHTNFSDSPVEGAIPHYHQRGNEAMYRGVPYVNEQYTAVPSQSASYQTLPPPPPPPRHVEYNPDMPAYGHYTHPMQHAPGPIHHRLVCVCGAFDCGLVVQYLKNMRLLKQHSPPSFNQRHTERRGRFGPRNNEFGQFNQQNNHQAPIDFENTTAKQRAQRAERESERLYNMERERERERNRDRDREREHDKDITENKKTINTKSERIITKKQKPVVSKPPTTLPSGPVSTITAAATAKSSPKPTEKTENSPMRSRKQDSDSEYEDDRRRRRRRSRSPSPARSRSRSPSLVSDHTPEGSDHE